jgi:hypothetical protein
MGSRRLTSTVLPPSNAMKEEEEEDNTPMRVNEVEMLSVWCS